MEGFYNRKLMGVERHQITCTNSGSYTSEKCEDKGNKITNIRGRVTEDISKPQNQ
jgi:hypothetical protein